MQMKKLSYCKFCNNRRCIEKRYPVQSGQYEFLEVKDPEKPAWITIIEDCPHCFGREK